MSISSAGITGIVISIIIVVLAIILIVLITTQSSSESSNNPTHSSNGSSESSTNPVQSLTEPLDVDMVKRKTPWTKYKSPFDKKYIDSFSLLPTSARQAYTLDSIKSTLASKTIIDLYNDHLTNSFAKWHTRTYVYPKGMVIFKAISNNMPNEIDIGYGRKAVLLKEDGKILATFPNANVDIKIYPSNKNRYDNDNNSVLVDNDSWDKKFGAKYFKAEANDRSNPIMPILPPDMQCCRDDYGRTGGGWIYKDDLWSDYRNRLTKVQSDIELSRKITKSDLKNWYISNKFKFIPNTESINSFDVVGDIEIPYLPVAMYIVVDSKEPTAESYIISDISKYITPISDKNLDLAYLESKIVDMKHHLETRHFNHIFPIGSIVFFVTDDLIKTFNDEGNSFVLCDGSTYKAGDYPKLSDKIGTNIVNEFDVPNLMNKVIVIGDGMKDGLGIDDISGSIKSFKIETLKQLRYNKNEELDKNKVIDRFNQEIANRGSFARGSTDDDKKMYGLITGPTDIWYTSNKLGTEVKPISTKGLDKILSNATIKFDKKMIKHLYVIPYIVADAF